MRDSSWLRARLWGMILVGLSLTLAPGWAQSIVRVTADVDVSAQDAQCEVQYVLKNGKEQLAEIPLSAILYHDTDVRSLSARDSSGSLSVSGSSTGDKFAGKVVLSSPVGPEAEYSFTLTYGVSGAVQRNGGHRVFSTPILHTPWRPVLSRDPAITIKGVLPEGTNLIWTSPRYLSESREGNRVVVTTVSPVLASYFRVEYTDARVGFFTPRTTSIVSFFGGAVILIVIWLLYAFRRRKTAAA